MRSSTGLSATDIGVGELESPVLLALLEGVPCRWTCWAGGMGGGAAGVSIAFSPCFLCCPCEQSCRERRPLLLRGLRGPSYTHAGMGRGVTGHTGQQLIDSHHLQEDPVMLRCWWVPFERLLSRGWDARGYTSSANDGLIGRAPPVRCIPPTSRVMAAPETEKWSAAKAAATTSDWGRKGSAKRTSHPSSSTATA